MEGFAVVGAVFASIAAFEVLASRYGRDTSDGDNWIVHRPER